MAISGMNWFPEKRVQDWHVKRVHHVLPVLQPVEVQLHGTASAEAPVVGEDGLAFAAVLQHVVDGECGFAVRRAHIREDQAVILA
jgi:hypothetical protein